MKILSTMPSRSTLETVLEPLYVEGPIKTPEIPEENRQLEIKRFVRDLRKNRQIRYTRYFMY
jgi:hypothetical protein